MRPATAEGSTTDLDIARAADGGVVISATLQPRAGPMSVIVVTLIAVVISVGILFGNWHIDRRVGTVAAAVISLFLAAATAGSILTQARLSRSCNIRATRDELTLKLGIGNRTQTSSYLRDQVLDISVGFGRREGLRFFQADGAWLIIEVQSQGRRRPRRITCLHRFGGNDVARVADVLRETLGMPKRSWP